MAPTTVEAIPAARYPGVGVLVPAHRCSACGAMVDVPDVVRSTTCTFCDSALVVEAAQTSEAVDRVVPFSIDKDAAVLAIRGWLQGRWFAPEEVRRLARPDEVKGIFIPFYAYDAVGRTQFQADVGIHWSRTETYTTEVDGETVTRTRKVQETDWHPLGGSHVYPWSDHLVSASRGLPEDEANELEPFDLGKALPYDPSLTAGWVSEHPTVPHDEARSTARAELARAQAAVVEAEHLPGDTHRNLHCSTASEVTEIRLVLLPVWIAVVRTSNGPLRLLVNGQTREVVGDVPTSWWKVGTIVVAVLGILAAAFIALSVGGTILAALGAT